MISAALATLIGALASSAIGVGSTILTNKKQIDLMREQNKFNSAEAEIARNFTAEEAEKQREWEASMSNTAYQRSVADMEAAGINPILAASNGGAGTPMGAYATAEAAHSAQTAKLDAPNFESIFNSALKAVSVGAALANPKGSFKVGVRT